MEPTKITLWQKEGKRADGTTFTSFSCSAMFNGVECWWNGFRKKVTKKDGTSVEVIELTIKPKDAAGKARTPEDAYRDQSKIDLGSIPF